jgi:N-acetylmuramoyl-L-alanine amidase
MRPTKPASRIAAVLACALLSLLSAAYAEGAAPPPDAVKEPKAADAKPAPALSPATAPASETAASAAAATAAMSAQKLASRLKARLAYDPLTGYGLIERSGARLCFALGVPRALFNWDASFAIDPPTAGEGGLGFSREAVARIERSFAEADAVARAHFSIAAILIDPGHGGKDPGAIGEVGSGSKKQRVVEKDVTFGISRKLFAALKAKYPEKQILITRDGDSYPTLEDRVEIANSVELAPNEAIIYVSIHANSSFNKNAKGFEVWYLNPEYRRTLVSADKPGGPGQEIAPILNAMLEEEFTTESIILARNIMGGLQAAVGADSQNRGIRADEWFVVRNARMPSVLIEAGFLTNPDEGRLLARDDYLARVADGVYNGVVDFVGYFESMRGAPSP